MSDEVELQIAWATLAPASRRSTEVFEDLVGRHRQPHRRYHGLRHVVWVLRHTRQLEAAIPECGNGPHRYDPVVVMAAACFHDAVYDPRADDNEARSATLAVNQLTTLGWTPQRCAVVGELITATAHHVAPERESRRQPSLEQFVLLDADLAVLGSEPAAYAAYVTGVRSEYGHLSSPEWAAGRTAVLEGLLGRDHLYATAPARSWWEQRARANVMAELAGLRG